MIKTLFLPAVLGSALLVAGCATAQMQEVVESGDPKMLYETQLGKAEAALKDVDAQGGAWRDTEEMIATAKKATEAQDYKKALELVSSAVSETQLAKEQSDSQKNAKPWLF